MRLIRGHTQHTELQGEGNADNTCVVPKNVKRLVRAEAKTLAYGKRGDLDDVKLGDLSARELHDLVVNVGKKRSYPASSWIQLRCSHSPPKGVCPCEFLLLPFPPCHHGDCGGELVRWHACPHSPTRCGRLRFGLHILADGEANVLVDVLGSARVGLGL